MAPNGYTTSQSYPPTINTTVNTTAKSEANSSGIGPQDDSRRYTLLKSPVQSGTMRIQFQYAARPPDYLIDSLKRDIGNKGLNPEDVQQQTKDSYERTFYEIEAIAPYNKLSHRSWDQLIARLKEYYVYPKELCAIEYKHQASFDG